MAGGELNPLYQQLGEVLSGVKALHDMIEIRHGQADRLHDLVRSDLATLRQDQRDLEDKLDCVVMVVQHDIETMRETARGSARAVADLAAAVDGLRGPVADIMALRARAAGAVLALGALGSVGLWLGEPLYRWAVEQLHGRF
jgi:hypothetical protein